MDHKQLISTASSSPKRLDFISAPLVHSSLPIKKVCLSEDELNDILLDQFPNGQLHIDWRETPTAIRDDDESVVSSQFVIAAPNTEAQYTDMIDKQNILASSCITQNKFAIQINEFEVLLLLQSLSSLEPKTPEGDKLLTPYRHFVQHPGGSRYLITTRSNLPVSPTPVSCFQPVLFWLVPNLGKNTIEAPTALPRARILLDWDNGCYSAAKTTTTVSKSQENHGRISDYNSTAKTTTDVSHSQEGLAMIEKEWPIPISELIRQNSPWPFPTSTQMVDFVTRVISEVDHLPQGLFFVLLSTSVYITNPSKLGTAKPLTFKLCPFSLGMNEELPEGVNRYYLTRRSTAILILQLALRTDDIHREDIQLLLPEAYKRSPGLMSAFSELWQSSSQSPPFSSHPSQSEMGRMIDVSPSIRAFNDIRTKTSKQFQAEHVAALLSGMSCVDSGTLHTVATESLSRYIAAESRTEKELSEAVSSIVSCVALVVPSGEMGLQDSKSSLLKIPNWICRMRIVERALDETQKSGDYNRLKILQQDLLSAGIARQLLESLGDNSHYGNKINVQVIVLIVRVSVLASLQFPILRVRLIFDSNVRKMCKMLIDAAPGGYISVQDRDRFVVVMLIMSDFMTWINKSNNSATGQVDPIDPKLMDIWRNIDEETLLKHVLPCWSPHLSDATTGEIVQKLEYFTTRTVRLVSSDPKMRDTSKKLHTYLGWLTYFAWNGTEQAANSSYRSLYTSYLNSLVFKCPHQMILLDNPKMSEQVQRNEDMRSIATTQVSARNQVYSRTNLRDLVDVKEESAEEPERLLTNFGDGALTELPSSATIFEERSDKRHQSYSSPPHDASQHYCKVQDGVINQLVGYMKLDDLNKSFEFCPIIRTCRSSVLLSNLSMWGIPANHRNCLYSALYVPSSFSDSAPDREDLCFFDIPRDNKHIIYHEPNRLASRIDPPSGIDPLPADLLFQGKYNSIRSISQAEMKSQFLSTSEMMDFSPITLVARNHRLCTTAHDSTTTGMMEVRIIDSGDDNNIIIGVTWDLKSDGATNGNNLLAELIPGRSSSSSLGLNIATGNIHYQSDDGCKLEIPYTSPCGTNSKVNIGIAGSRIYFIVDDVFYPPVPSLYLPIGVDVHALIRIGCLGVKLNMRALTKKWNVTERHNSDGSLVCALSNPVGHSLYLAELRSKVCPHYSAHKRPPHVRPKLEGLDESIIAALDPECRDLIKLIQLSNVACTNENCIAPNFIRTLVTRMTAT